MSRFRFGALVRYSTLQHVFSMSLKMFESILINCRFTGLSGPNHNQSYPGVALSANSRPCFSDQVETPANVTPQKLRENMVEIVHQLLTPLYEAFDFFALSQTIVDEELSRMRENRF